MGIRGKILSGCLVALLVGALVSISGVSQADTAEPTLTDLAWYWKDASGQSVTTPAGDVTVETPNPFCPVLPGAAGDPTAGRTCAPDRLPVWVRGDDYEEPYMLSAVAFDLSLVPVGSEITSFTVTFLEDEANCDSGEDSTPTRCRTTDPLNIEGQSVQACAAAQIIGGGEARKYSEVPDHNCTDASPLGVRKEIKNDDEADPDDTDPDHTWTFDLTPYAQDWVENFTTTTGVILRPVQAKKEEDQQADWRVVLAGPKEVDGVVTKIVYVAPEVPVTPPPGGGTGSTGGTGTGSTSAPTFDSGTPTFDSGSSSGFDTGTPSGTGDSGGGDVGDPVEAGEEELAAEPTGASVEEMPGYVWLAILAGIVAFTLVRSVVVEKATGTRPNGALAQIRTLNAQRHGTAEAATAAGETTSGGGIGAWFGARAANIRDAFRRGE